MSGSDPLESEERARILAEPRPRPARHLPIAGRVRTELLPSRETDAAYRPFLAVWEITLRCDLACRHCGSRAGAARPDELSTAEALDLVEQLADLGTREVTVIGGEAYLRPDWLEIIAAIARRGMQPTMVTGGRGFDRDRAEAAAAAGLHSLSVSVDGSAVSHDRLRGLAGSHAAAVAAIDAAREAGIPLGVNTQVNRLTMGELSAVLELIAGRGVSSWQLIITVPMGRAADEPDVLLQPHDIGTLFPLLGELVARARALGVEVVAGNNVGYFGPFETALRGRLAHGHGGSCGAGVITMGIEADGTIKGCPSLATAAWSGGSVRDASLKDIWERTSQLRHMRDRTRAEAWGFCATCYYVETCRAGCTWMSDSLLGRPGNNPYCHHRVLELARRGLRERVERVEHAPGAPFDRARFVIIEEAIP